MALVGCEQQLACCVVHSTYQHLGIDSSVSDFAPLSDDVKGQACVGIYHQHGNSLLHQSSEGKRSIC